MDIRKNNAIILTNRTRSIDDFTSDLRKYPVLSESEERELLKRIKENNDKEAKDKLVVSNQRFVFGLAKCYCSNECVLDLVDEANIGLIEAIEKFDINSQNRFLSFAIWYMRQKINHYLLTDNQLVKRTNSTKYGNKIAKYKNKYYCENGRVPSSSEIMEYFKKEYDIAITVEKDVYDITNESINCYYDCEENNTVENTSSEFNDKTASYNDYEKTINDDHIKYMIKQCIKTLNSRDKDIIEMHYGLGNYSGNGEKTYEEIGNCVGLSSERVRQIIVKSQKKMKTAYKYFVNQE